MEPVGVDPSNVSVTTKILLPFVSDNNSFITLFENLFTGALQVKPSAECDDCIFPAELPVNATKQLPAGNQITCSQFEELGDVVVVAVYV